MFEPFPQTIKRESFIIKRRMRSVRIALGSAIILLVICYLLFIRSELEFWETVVIGLIVFLTCAIAFASLRRIAISEQRYRSLFDYHAEGILSFNIYGKLLQVNHQFETLSGYTTKEILERDFLDLLEVNQIPRIVDCFVEACSGTSHHLEITLFHKSGQPIEMSVTLVPMLAAGQIVGAYAVCKDITANKRHKKEIESLHKHYQLLLNSVSEGIIGIDLNGNINFWNTATELMTGWSSQEALNHKVGNLVRYTSNDGTPIPDEQCTLNLSLADGKFRHVKDGLLWRKDGSSFPAEFVISPILKDEGPHVGIVCSFKDVTDSKRTEELLRKSDKLSAVGQLAAGVAHEIRNPLTALKGFLRLMPAISTKEQGYIAIMDRELKRIESIVNEFLFVARPHSTVFAPHQLETIMIDTIELLKLQALMNSVEIISYFQPNLPSLLGDEHQLKQVFINIMKNAIEAMPGGGEMYIQVTFNDQTSQLLVRIKDTGGGIAPDRLPQLGEPFYSTKEKGTGLGLMVSYKILEAHNGYMVFNSTLNVGTQVDIYFPTS